jgi:hypothetical protein
MHRDQATTALQLVRAMTWRLLHPLK